MENKTNETKEVTMEQLMKVIEENHKEEIKHLKEIEQAQALTVNTCSTIFSMILERKDILDLEENEEKELIIAISALSACTEHLMEVSGLNKFEESLKERFGNVNVKVITNIDDLMKELFK